jgi:L-lactate dehydrogenase complex protein LldG
MKGNREQILGRIEEALRFPAPQHHHSSRASSAQSTPPFREWLPKVDPSYEDRLAHFARQSELLRTEFLQCSDPAAAAAHLAHLAGLHGWQRIALHSGELTDAVAALLPPQLVQLRTGQGYEKVALESCDAGLTECEVLVAQTGSVCVTSRSSGGRALSVLPPHHVVVARQSQLVTDLSAAYEHLADRYGAEYPSFISFISGPSRTGDIERILVLGAHGPKKLTVLLLP